MQRSSLHAFSHDAVLRNAQEFARRWLQSLQARLTKFKSFGAPVFVPQRQAVNSRTRPIYETAEIGHNQARLLNALCSSCTYVPLLIPKPQHSFLNLATEIVGQVNDLAVSPFAIVHLIRSLWHLNESFLAFRLNDLYVRNANEATDIHCRKTLK